SWAVRQGVSERRSGLCLRTLPSQRRSRGSGQPDIREHRSVRQGTVVGRTGARAEKSNLSTTSCAAGLHTQAGWEAETVRHTDNPGSGCANLGHAGTRTNLRGRLAEGTICLSGGPQPPDGIKTRPKPTQQGRG